MARALRISFEGAWYHIMNRGVDCQPIFYSQSHLKMFLGVLDELYEKHSIEIHAYCLMGNHYHLMVRTPEANISKLIHHLNTVYAIRFNKRNSRDGPVFRGRFHSVLVQDDAHLLHLSRYIHLNPVKAKMVEKAEYYKWSSYQAYLGLRTPPEWLKMDLIKENFSNEGMNSYQAFVDHNTEMDLEQFYQKKPLPPILGTPEFIKQVKSKVNVRGDKYDVPQLCYLRNKYDLQSILDVVIKVTGVTRVKIFTATRGRRNDERLIFMYIARQSCGYTLNEIRDFLGMKCRTTITMAVKRMKIFQKEDSLLRARLECCLTELLADFPADTTPCGKHFITEAD